MLVNGKKLLEIAKLEKFAIPQYNINNLEWTKAILEEMQEENLPVILGVSEGASKYMGGFNTVFKMVEGLIKDLNITIPVVLHLDHGTSLEVCKKAIDAGFTSVMIDASKYDLRTNVEVTKSVVEYANKFNVSVEAEVGHIGGVEDGIEGGVLYAKYDDCLELIKTGITSLAPAVGSSHGIYKGEPNLNFELIRKIDTIPLVLHGGSGISEDNLKKAIESGINKINVNTELQVSWYNKVRKYVEENNNQYDPRKVISSGVQDIKNVIKEKNKIFFGL